MVPCSLRPYTPQIPQIIHARSRYLPVGCLRRGCTRAPGNRGCLITPLLLCSPPRENDFYLGPLIVNVDLNWEPCLSSWAVPWLPKAGLGSASLCWPGHVKPVASNSCLACVGLLCLSGHGVLLTRKASCLSPLGWRRCTVVSC